jgi:hypothetical protein
MPAITWRERVGDIPFPGDSQSRVRGRPPFSLAGPVPCYFSLPEHMPTPDVTPPRRSSSASSLHRFPFRAPSAHPEPFERTLSQTSRSASSSSRNVSASRGIAPIDVDLARRVSRKGPGTPRDVANHVHVVESAVAARLDEVRPSASAHGMMRRIGHPGLRSRYYDQGRKSTAPARGPLTTKVVQS